MNTKEDLKKEPYQIILENKLKYDKDSVNFRKKLLQTVNDAKGDLRRDNLKLLKPGTKNKILYSHKKSASNSAVPTFRDLEKNMRDNTTRLMQGDYIDYT